MFTNWLTHLALARSLDERLRDAVITAAWTQDRDEVTFALECAGAGMFLQVSCAPRAACCFVKSGVARARRNTLDVLESTTGRHIQMVRIAEDDRVLGFLLDDHSILVAFMHGAHANLVHLGANAELRSTFKTTASTPRLPDTWTLTAPRVDAEHFVAALAAHPGAELARVLRDVRPWLSGACATEVAHRAQLPLEVSCASLPPDAATRLAAACAEVTGACMHGSWHVYIQRDPASDSDEEMSATGLPRDATAVAIAPCALTHRDGTSVLRFDDASDAMWLFVRRRGRTGRTDAVRGRVLRVLTAETARLERLLARIETPADLRRRADTYEKYGNLLMINLTRAPEQPGRMTVEDLFVDPRLVVAIPLDVRLGVLENAQRYFDKARSSRGAADYAGDRAEAARKRLERVECFQRDIAACPDTRALQDLFTGYADLMASLGLTPKGDTNEQPFPFRRFVVAGGFEVWAGKSSANNDELTVRWAKPHDLWFHARGVGGSHVIIRSGSAPGEPSKEAIREAAAIAAYYSKHRNAKSVPVAYTEKKYVRKPKGVPAGTVYLEREKVIMVAPALPENAEEEG